MEANKPERKVAAQLVGGKLVGGKLVPAQQSVPTQSPEWEAQLARLATYKAAHGDCNVPQGWAEDGLVPRLGWWVSDQRVLKNKLYCGKPSKGMTAERAAKLEALGFFEVFAPAEGAEPAGVKAPIALPVDVKGIHAPPCIFH
jgi:hypothetical protein